jgi:hypothetical protein
MPKEAFAALDFIKTSRCYPEDLKGLAKRFEFLETKEGAHFPLAFKQP